MEKLKNAFHYQLITKYVLTVAEERKHVAFGIFIYFFYNHFGIFIESSGWTRIIDSMLFEILQITLNNSEKGNKGLKKNLLR